MGPSSLLFSRFACQTPLKSRFMFKSGQGVLLVSLLADSAGYARDKLPLKGPPTIPATPETPRSFFGSVAFCFRVFMGGDAPTFICPQFAPPLALPLILFCRPT